MVARKISALTAMTTMLGSETFPLYDPAGSTAALKNKQISLTNLNANVVPRSIAYPSKGSVTCNSNGAITLSPAEFFGVNYTTTDLADADFVNLNPMVALTQGVKRYGPILKLKSQGAAPGDILHVQWTGHNATYPRMYIDGSCQFYTQASMNVSGIQVTNIADSRGNQGAILLPTGFGCMYTAWQDVKVGMLIRGISTLAFAENAQYPFVYKTWENSSGGTAEFPALTAGHIPWVMDGTAHQRFGTGVTEATIQTGFDVGIKRTATGTLTVTDGTASASGLGYLSCKPAQKADGSAVNGELYYSTTSSKLAFKDYTGTVNVAY